MSLQPHPSYEPSIGSEQQRRKSRLLDSLRTGLPTLPGYVFELNALLSCMPVDLKRVSQVIRTDPSLTAQVLRICNSSALELRRDLLSVDEAVVLLGAERLRGLALTCSLVEYVGQRATGNDVQSFWQHSSMTALLSERLARWTGYAAPEQAYLAGLLHDIGVLPILEISFAESLTGADVPPGDLFDNLEFERNTYGLDHCALGRSIGIAWKFPAQLVDVFEHHHQPHMASHDPQLVGIVTAADRFCQRRGVALGGKPVDLGSAAISKDGEMLCACVPGLDARQGQCLAEVLTTDFLSLIQLVEPGNSELFAGAARMG